jgi:predicted permease
MRFWRVWSQQQSREADLERELRSDIDAETEEQRQAGLSVEEAACAARRALGNTTQIKEDVRMAWGFQWLETLLQDLRYGVRQLRRGPGFTTVAVLTLALGIGANTAIFSLVDTILLRVLPVRNPEQLVRLTWVTRNHGGDEFFSYPTFRLLADNNRTLSGVIAFHSLDNVNFVVDGQPGLASGQAVSGNYFTMLGIRAVLGRMLAPSDDEPQGGSPVAVISYGYWTTRFNRSAAVIGKGITVDGASFTVIGVTPPEFFGLEPGEPVDVSIPLGQVPRVKHGWAATGSPYDIFRAPFRNWLRLMARLREGVPRPLALANLQPIYKQAMRQADEGLKGLPIASGQAGEGFPQIRLQLESGSRGLTTLRRQFSKPLLFLLTVVGVLLLIACTNVANLLLARASSRQREIGLRMALGAGRLRVIRQLLTESVLLSTAGGALGTVLAYWASTSLVALMSYSQSAIRLSVRPDARVLAFTAIVSFLAAIVFGLAPAWRVSRLELSRAVKDGGQDKTGLHHHFRLGEGLVVSQITLSLVLVVGAGLLVRTLERLRDLDPGFDAQNVLLFSLNPGMVGYKNSQVAQLYEELSGRIKAMPGVRAVSFSDFSPLGRRFTFTVPSVESYTPRPGENIPVSVNFVSPGYFKTLGTGILLGREFTRVDRVGTPKVAVINKAMARYFFGNANPIGRRFSIPGWVGDTSEIEIVGVAENAKLHDLREQTVPQAYFPWLQMPDSLFGITFEVRTALNPRLLAASVRRLIKQTDGRVPLFDVKTLTEQVNDSLVQERLVASLSTLFGFVALFLTCIGLYGLISYSVTRKTHEIGIRMALGAQRLQVLKLVLGRGMILALIGVGVGSIAAMGLTRLMASLLYGVKPTDFLTFVLAPLALTGVALLACYIPARRAANVDPLVALRYE